MVTNPYNLTVHFIWTSLVTAGLRTKGKKWEHNFQMGGKEEVTRSGRCGFDLQYMLTSCTLWRKGGRKKPLNYEEPVKDIKHNHFPWVRSSWKNFHYYCWSSSWISLNRLTLSLLFHLNINNQNIASSIKIIQTMWSPLLTISVHIECIMITIV
jgi:hypothetical protein